MTSDQTKCQHCGAELTVKTLLRVLYECGSMSYEGNFTQSTTCEVWTLRAKVAAQQELLKECRDTLCVLGTAYALDLVDKIDAKLEEVK